VSQWSGVAQGRFTLPMTVVAGNSFAKAQGSVNLAVFTEGRGGSVPCSALKAGLSGLVMVLVEVGREQYVRSWD